MDTNAAYWIEDANGNLMVYNGQGQYLDVVGKNQTTDFMARFNQGQRDMSQDYRPGSGSGGNGGSGTEWASIGMRGSELSENARQFGARLGEDQRQYDQTMGMEKSMFDQKMQLDQATQKWREAVDARDFEAAEYWKARSQELNQNQLAMGYTQMLAGMKGPQDWIKYGRLSRGESPLSGPDGQTVPLDQALPEWARGFKPGTYHDSRGKAPGQVGQGGAMVGGAQGGPSATPSMAAPSAQQPNQMMDLTKSTVGAPAWTQTPEGFRNQAGVSDHKVETPGGRGPVWAQGLGGAAISLSDWAIKNMVKPNA